MFPSTIRRYDSLITGFDVKNENQNNKKQMPNPFLKHII